MPVLHRYSSAPGYYAIAHVKGSVLNFQLTEQALQELFALRLDDNSKFPLRVLLNLMRRGEAFTCGGNRLGHQTGKRVFDFPDDQKAEKLIPRCCETGGFDDLHLVVWHNGPNREAQLLSAAPRNKLQYPISLSIPLPLLSLKTLNSLQQMDKVPACNVIRLLRAWYESDNEAQWDATCQQDSQAKQMTLLEDDERSLFNYCR